MRWNFIVFFSTENGERCCLATTTTATATTTAQAGAAASPTATAKARARRGPCRPEVGPAGAAALACLTRRSTAADAGEPAAARPFTPAGTPLLRAAIETIAGFGPPASAVSPPTIGVLHVLADLAAIPALPPRAIALAAAAEGFP
jgi:hypothetical protein